MICNYLITQELFSYIGELNSIIGDHDMTTCMGAYLSHFLKRIGKLVSFWPNNSTSIGMLISKHIRERYLSLL